MYIDNSMDLVIMLGSPPDVTTVVQMEQTLQGVKSPQYPIVGT